MNCQDFPAETSKHELSSRNPINVEESTCSHKFTSPKLATQNGDAVISSSSDKVHIESDFAVSCSKDDVDASGNIGQNCKLHTFDANNDVSICKAM